MRIGIIDPHLALRSGLRAFLEAEPDMEVVAAGPDGSALGTRAVDVVIVDEGVAGIATRRTRAVLAALSSRTAVVVMGMGEPESYGVAQRAAGAAGYWPKFRELDELLSLVRDAVVELSGGRRAAGR